MNELSSMIESYPTRLAAALRARDEAAQAVEQLDAQVRSVEWRLSAENTGDLQLEHELALLELDYDRLRGEVELSYRRDMQADKPTEAAIVAMMRADQRLIDAKRAILDKKLERDTYARRVGMARPTVMSPELEQLRADLETAHRAYRAAERYVETVKAELLSCQLFMQLDDTSRILPGSLEIAA